MSKPNIFQTTVSIWAAISYKKNNDGRFFQFKQSSYLLPVLDEKKTKQNIAELIQSFLAAHTISEILALLMECLDETKFQYLLSHNGFRLAKNIPKEKRVNVADIYAFSKALTYCFSFLPQATPSQTLTIVSGVMAPAGQDLGSSLLKQLWQTQGHTVYNLGTKIKPHTWLEAVDQHQPDFLSISMMLNTCIPSLRDLLGLLSARKNSVRVCVGGIAINKLIAMKLSQEFHVPLFYGTDFISLQKTAKPDHEDKICEKISINLPTALTALFPREKICCYRIPLPEVVVAGGNGQDAMKFLAYFNSAVIVTTSSQPSTIRDAKMLSRQLLQIEQFLEEAGHLAFSFYYPIPCPFCLPADCRKKDGMCMNPAYTRPSPKTFHINLSKTMKNAKITDLGLSTLILVK